MGIRLIGLIKQKHYHAHSGDQKTVLLCYHTILNIPIIWYARCLPWIMGSAHLILPCFCVAIPVAIIPTTTWNIGSLFSQMDDMIPIFCSHWWLLFLFSLASKTIYFLCCNPYFGRKGRLQGPQFTHVLCSLMFSHIWFRVCCTDLMIIACYFSVLSFLLVYWFN